MSQLPNTHREINPETKTQLMHNLKKGHKRIGELISELEPLTNLNQISDLLNCELQGVMTLFSFVTKYMVGGSISTPEEISDMVPFYWKELRSNNQSLFNSQIMSANW